jgi:16S rRNA (uracil1498-N3)-methyltransferase
MPAERFYLPVELHCPQQLIVEGKEHHHIVNVMRSRIGDLLEVVNGNGSFAEARLCSVDKRSCVLEVESCAATVPPAFEVIIAQALPRQAHLDIIVEKGTELGMTQLWLFPGDSSDRKELSPAHRERVDHLAIAAMKQCGRLYLPRIEICRPLASWSRPSFPLYYGDLTPGSVPLAVAMAQHPPAGGLIFAVGPEGGWSGAERKLFDTMGGRGVLLHENILRAETASLTALAIVSHLRLASAGSP